MGKQYTVKLSLPEINHINGLLAGNEWDGVHTAPAEQYWKLSRIVAKLEDAVEAGSVPRRKRPIALAHCEPTWGE